MTELHESARLLTGDWLRARAGEMIVEQEKWIARLLDEEIPDARFLRYYGVCGRCKRRTVILPAKLHVAGREEITLLWCAFCLWLMRVGTRMEQVARMVTFAEKKAAPVLASVAD